MTLNEKKYNYKTVNRVVVKDVKYIFIGLKNDLFGCFRIIEKIRDKDKETGLKEGGRIEMSSTVLPLRDARSLRLNTYYWR